MHEARSPADEGVLTSTAGLQCWGFNGDGQLGIGSTTNSNVPVRVTGF